MKNPQQAVLRHVVARGEVQGVGYRAFVEQAALAQGIEGFVRNRRDGTVEAVFAGAPEAVDMVIATCRRGPRWSRVSALDVRDARPEEFALRRPGELFSVLPTV